MSTLFFDTETSGLVLEKEPLDSPKQPHLMQIGAILFDDDDKLVAEYNVVVQPEKDYVIHPKALEAHGITLEYAKKYGVARSDAFWLFQNLVSVADDVVAHNISFDKLMMRIVADSEEYGGGDLFKDKNLLCTMETATPILKLPFKNAQSKYTRNKRGKAVRRKRKYKWPTLQECSLYFFGKEFEDAHDAMVDVRVCVDVYFKMKEMGVEIHG